MEKYAVDLDKVLDELELHNDDEMLEQSPLFVQNAPSSSYTFQPLYQDSTILNTYDKIDYQEADFSIRVKPPQILHSIAALNNQNQSFESSSLVSTNSSKWTSVPTNQSSYSCQSSSQFMSAQEDEFILDKHKHKHKQASVDALLDHVTECTTSRASTASETFTDISTKQYQASHESNLHYLKSQVSTDESCSSQEISCQAECNNPVENEGQSVHSDTNSVHSLNTMAAPVTTCIESTESLLSAADLQCSNSIDKSSDNTYQYESGPNDKVMSSDHVCDKVICDATTSLTEQVYSDKLSPTVNSSNAHLTNVLTDESHEINVSTLIETPHNNNCALEKITNKQDVVNENIDIAQAISEVQAVNNEPIQATDDKNEINNDVDINTLLDEDLDKYLQDLSDAIELENEQLQPQIDESPVSEKSSDFVVTSPSDTQIENQTLISIETTVKDLEVDQIQNDTAQKSEISVEPEDNNEVDVQSENRPALQTQIVDEFTLDNENSFSPVTESESPAIEAIHDQLIQEPSLTVSPCEQSQEVLDQIVQPDNFTVDNNTNINNAINLAESRGGLVQNIAYFERQEMPNGLTEEEQTLGKVKPFWIPDEEAQSCLHCDSKFTLIKRRHHCRSCGKVLCSQCCNYKAKLMYLDNKEARVCQLCYVILMRIEDIERTNGRPIDISDMSAGNNSGENTETSSPLASGHIPDPNNPAEYCSTISPWEQASESRNIPPPTVMVPVGVLKRPGSSNYRRGPNTMSDTLHHGERLNENQVKQVIFSDGVRPGGDLVEEPGPSRMPEERHTGRTQLQLPTSSKVSFGAEQSGARVKISRLVVADNKGINLPPIINYNAIKVAEPGLPSKPTYSQLLQCLRTPHLPPITFGLTKNLFINVKLISKLCCNSVECWSFYSRGLATVGQDEIIVCFDCESLLSKSNEESNKCESNQPDVNLLDFPRDLFRLFTMVYDSALKASPIVYTELQHLFIPEGLFGSKQNAGFIFVRPTLQCLQNLLLPSPPLLLAILIHKWEIPWAKVFPLRLVLRLGHEYKMYPTPVINFANRKPAYYEIGHTIMNVLADFRNFQYTLSPVDDLVIHVEDRKRVSLQIPKLSYEKTCKVLSTSNEHVLAFAGNFSLKADSHFVCVQSEEENDVQGQYNTELACLPTSEKKLTAASFIVFSGALKSSTGLKAKMNIVEDGLLVQIPSTTMEELRAAIRDMKDFRIDCCKVNDTKPAEEWVQIEWVNHELNTNLGVRSQIDGFNLEGVHSVRIYNSPDYTNHRYLIRWIEVFLLKINENSRSSEMLNTSRLAESVSQAFCVALIDYLEQLFEAGLTKISLRVSLDVDRIGYEAGSAGEQLPPQYTSQMDSTLIPAIMENISTTGIEDPLVIELLFYILLK